MFRMLEITFGIFWGGLGLWVLLRALPEVRTRVLAGKGTPADAARLNNIKNVGVASIAAGLLALLAALLEF